MGHQASEGAGGGSQGGSCLGTACPAGDTGVSLGALGDTGASPGDTGTPADREEGWLREAISPPGGLLTHPPGRGAAAGRGAGGDTP